MCLPWTLGRCPDFLPASELLLCERVNSMDLSHLLTSSIQELIKHDNAKTVIYDILSDISDSKGIISKYKVIY